MAAGSSPIGPTSRSTQRSEPAPIATRRPTSPSSGSCRDRQSPGHPIPRNGRPRSASYRSNVDRAQSHAYTMPSARSRATAAS